MLLADAAERVVAALPEDLLISVSTPVLVADLSTDLSVALLVVPVDLLAASEPLLETVRPDDATADEPSLPLTLLATPPEPVVVLLP